VKIYPVQIIGGLFGVFYIIGLPVFFYLLIKQAIKLVDAHGYRDEESQIQFMVKKYQDENPTATAADLKKVEKEAKEHLKRFYYNEVKTNPMPQTYLYVAYDRKFRFFKIFQMFQKFLLIVVLMFLPAKSLGSIKLGIVTGAVAVGAFASMIFAPFSDAWENVLDISSGVANTLNSFTGFALVGGWISGGFATVAMFFVNIGGALMFLAVTVGSPLRSLCGGGGCGLSCCGAASKVAPAAAAPSGVGAMSVSGAGGNHFHTAKRLKALADVTKAQEQKLDAQKDFYEIMESPAGGK
jgi:gas vesicle protein